MPFEVRLSDESFETYELDPPPYTLNTTKKELKRMYYDMVSIRYDDGHWVVMLGRNVDINSDAWKWPPTASTKRRKSGDSAIFPPVKKRSPPA